MNKTMKDIFTNISKLFKVKTVMNLLNLVTDICKRNGISRLSFTDNAEGNLTLHKYFASTSCPRPYLESKMGRIAEAGKRAVGSNTAYRTTGNYSTALGHSALNNNTSGSYNTSVGFQAGMYSWNGTTAGGSISTTLSRVTCLGAYAYATGGNQVQLGGSGDSVYGASSYNTRSDARDKADITNLTYDPLAFINELTPRNYRIDQREAYLEDEVISLEEWRDTGLTMEEQHTYSEELDLEKTAEAGHEIYRYRRKVQRERDGSKKRSRLHNGFVAQEVKTAMDKLGFDFAGWQDHSKNGGGDVQTLAYEELIAPLVGAVQILTKKIEKLEEKTNV